MIEPPEILFLKSPVGGAAIALVALAALAVTILWARRPGHPDRIAAVWAATGTSLMVAAITGLAAAAGWWRGGFFTIPILVFLAIDWPLSIAGYTLWLSLYRWLARISRHALPVYAIVALVFIPVVLIVDPIQMQRGQFTMGSGYTVWIDALVGQVVMWSPVLFYEAIRWAGRRTGRPQWTN